MKRWCYLFVILLVQLVWSKPGYGQQLPQYSLYTMNNFILNPAIAGIEDYTDIRLSVRKQWSGIPDAPQTVYGTVNLPVYADVNTGRRQGLGALIMMDKAGVWRDATAQVAYAYHLPLNEALKISFGVAGGVDIRKLDVSNLALKEQSDPVLSYNAYSKVSPELNAGVWLYSDAYYLGIASQHMLAGQDLARHFFATGGYRFKTGDVYITPSTLIKYVSQLPVSVDLTVKAQFGDVLWTGVSYQQRQGFSIMAGIYISSWLNLSYAYDLATSSIGNYGKGSHEILLGLQLNKLYNCRCPKIPW